MAFLVASMLQHALVAFSVAAILAPFSYYAGIGARLLKLPQITGYLVSGIMCGPYLLGILSKESVRSHDADKGCGSQRVPVCKRGRVCLRVCLHISACVPAPPTFSQLTFLRRCWTLTSLRVPV